MAQWNYNNPSLVNPNLSVLNQPGPFPHSTPSMMPFPYLPGFVFPSNHSVWNVPVSPSNFINTSQGVPPQSSTGLVGCGNNVPHLTNSQQQWIRLCRQRSADQQFLDQFMKSRIPIKRELPSTSIKICEFKEQAREVQNLISQLEKARKDPDRQWTAQDIDSLQPIRDRLNFAMEQLNAPDVQKQIKEKIQRRKVKRGWIRSKKERQAKEMNEMTHKRRELDQQIDKRVEMIRAQISKERKDKQTQKEADSVLSEVRRKQNEAKRLLELLESLQELRQLRAASLESRHGLYSTEEYNVRFATVVGKASQLMKNQLAVYDKEEETLKAMMTHHEKKEEDNIKKQWNSYSKRPVHL